MLYILLFVAFFFMYSVALAGDFADAKKKILEKM